MAAVRGIRKIIFLDTDLTARKYLNKERGKTGEEELAISMEPDAYFYLKKRKPDLNNIYPCVDNKEREKMLLRSRSIEEWLEKEIDILSPELGIKEAFRNSIIFFLRYVVNYCIFNISVILDGIDKYRPDILSAQLSGRRNANDVFIEPAERYLGFIVEKIAKNKSLGFRDIVLEKNYPSVPEFIHKLHSVRRFSQTYLKYKAWEAGIISKARSSDKGCVLFTTRMCQMDKIYGNSKARRKDLLFDVLEGPAIPLFDIPAFIVASRFKRYFESWKNMKNLIEGLQTKIERDREIFTYRGVSFGDIVARKIKSDIANYILGEFLWTTELDSLVSRLKMKAVVSAGNRTDDIILSELCKKTGTRSILISHGSFVRPKTRQEEIEWGGHGKNFLRGPFSHLALQTPLAEGYLERFPSKSIVVKTGPLIWGKPIDTSRSSDLFKKMFGDTADSKKVKIIVHAGTIKRTNVLRFHTYETPYEYMQAVHDLACAVEKVDNTVLVVRFRPSTGIRVEDIKDFLSFSNKTVLSVKEPFGGVLGMADLLVSFSSTTIEEALQNRIPVLLYGGGGRYQYLSGNEISLDKEVPVAPVYFVKDKGSLEYGLRSILEKHCDEYENGDLFDPFIYPYDKREPIHSLFGGGDKK